MHYSLLWVATPSATFQYAKFLDQRLNWPDQVCSYSSFDILIRLLDKWCTCMHATYEWMVGPYTKPGGW